MSATRPRRSALERRVPLTFSVIEEAQLRRLVGQAFDLRGTGYLRDALDAIIEFNEQTLPDRLERHAERAAA